MSYEVLVGRAKALARTKEHITRMKRNVDKVWLDTGDGRVYLEHLQTNEREAFAEWLLAVEQRHQATLHVLNRKIVELDNKAASVIGEVLGK